MAVAGIGLLGMAVLSRTGTATISPAFPDVVLWAWEARQDLRFIRPGTAGIAFLERTVWLDPQGVRALPRSQALLFRPGTPLMATVRLEAPVGGTRGLPAARQAANAVAVAATRTQGIAALQIDFDARLSERQWYAEFLRELRQAVPRDLPISITALESWCEESRSWLGRLPVAEATPMLFQMGVNERREPLRFAAPVCDSSVGVATDEMPRRIPSGARRIYIFHAGTWTEQAYQVALERVREWRAK